MRGTVIDEEGYGGGHHLGLMALMINEVHAVCVLTITLVKALERLIKPCLESQFS
jgi:hypothetical protein